MNLKSLLKNIKLNESTISMLLGAVVIVVVGVLVVNYFRGLDTGTTIPAIETEEAQTLPTTHVVAGGEDLWSIAEEYYGSGYNWVDIAEANDLASPGSINEGQELTIPNVEPKLVGALISDTLTPTAEVAEPTAEPTATPEPTMTPEPTATVEPTAAVEPTQAPEENQEESEVMEETEEVMQESENIDNAMATIEGDTYTVVHGDNLWNIAVRAYGDGYKWVEIAEANDLVNPGVIHAGNVFVLPR